MAGGHLFRAICRQPQQDNGHLCGHFSAGGRGIWRATTRPVCTWPPAQRTAAIHVGMVSGSYSFLPFAFIFHVPFFIFPFFLSLSLFNPPPLTLTLRSFPTLALVFTPTPFTPELLPLMNRGGITRCTRGANGAAASAGWKDRESGGARGGRRRRDSKPSRRYLRAYNEEGRGFIRGDSFSNFCPALILLFLIVSRLDVARKKKVLKAATKYDALRFKLW